MTSINKLFVFLQPELNSIDSGHFYQYIKGIQETLSKRHLPSSLVAGENFKVVDKNIPQYYFKSRKLNVSNRFLMIWHILIGNLNSFNDFKVVMRKLTTKNAQTIFFVDTILNNRVLGLAFACRVISKEYPATKFAVVFRFTYRSNSPIYTWIQKKLHFYFYLIVKSIVTQKRFLIITDSDLLKNMYDINIGAVTDLFPIPIRQYLYNQNSISDLQFADSCIGFIGGRARYKGLDIFLRIIGRLSNTNTSFLIHGLASKKDLYDYGSEVLSGQELTDILKLSDRISVKSFLSEDDYLLMYKKISIILIPYTSLQFAEGTSSIFAESVSAGIVPIVPSNTWMSSELRKAELSELVVDFSDLESVVRKIDNILNDFITIKQKMDKFIHQWKRYHSAELFTDHLLSGLQS